ncbi:PEGA domain-containing protein [Myxococcota bacterium]
MTRERQPRENGPTDVAGAIRHALRKSETLSPDAREAMLARMAMDVDAIARQHALRQHTPEPRSLWQPRWRVLVASAAVIVAAVALPWLLSSSSENTGRAAIVQPRLITGASALQGLVLDRQPLGTDELFRAPSDGVVRLDLGNVADVSLLGSSELLVHGWQQSDLTTRLMSGYMVATYRQQGDGRFVLHADGVRVTVTGTLLCVGNAPEGVEVGVLSGKVQVTFQGGSAAVGAGEQWTGGKRGGSLTALKPDMRQRMLDHQAMFLPRSETEGTLIVDGHPVGGRVIVDGVLLGNAPLAARWPANTVHLEIVAPDMETHEARVLVAAEQTTRVAYSLRPQFETNPLPPVPANPQATKPATPDITVTVPGEPVEPAESVEDRYLRAETAMLNGDLLEAREILEDVIQRFPTTQQSLTAHLDLARLLADQLANPSEALRLLDSLLRRPDAGVLREPALSLRCHLLLTHGPRTQATSCVIDLLREYPETSNAATLELMLEKEVGPAASEDESGLK